MYLHFRLILIFERTSLALSTPIRPLPRIGRRFISFLAKRFPRRRRLLSRWWATVASSRDSLIILIRDLNRKRRGPAFTFSSSIGDSFARRDRNGTQPSIRDYHSPLICPALLSETIHPARSEVPFADCLAIKYYRKSERKKERKDERATASLTSYSSGRLWITVRTGPFPSSPFRLPLLLMRLFIERFSIFHIVARA